jgi:hypothetical protein
LNSPGCGIFSEPKSLCLELSVADTIDYVATDTWGNTATSTRTIIIEAAASSTSIVDD